MRAVGIDTVILIRAGYRDRAAFNSAVLAREQPMRPAYLDLVDLFLTQDERCGMDFYSGIYGSGRYWHEGKPEREVELNLRYKIEAAAASGVEKLITFEFSHFLSPNSIYHSAHNLNQRYQEYLRDSV